MSQFTVHIKLPAYLDQWLCHDYWDYATGRVRFENGSNCHCIMSVFLKERPEGYTEPEDDDGLTPIAVPTFKGLRPDTHCWLSREGEAALVSAIKRNFRALLDRELSRLYSHDVCITDIIYAFMELHGIDTTETNWETIRQMYKRMRDKSVRSSVK